MKKKKTRKKKRFQFDFRLARIVFKTSLQAALSGQKNNKLMDCLSIIKYKQMHDKRNETVAICKWL